MSNPSTIEEQIEILKEKGFSILDTDNAEKYLKHIGYYRLSHYFNYFLNNHNWEEYSFKNILNLYIFDRKLKLKISDTIERIEISLKTNIINNLSLLHNNSCFFTEESIYWDNDKYQRILESLENEKNKNKSLRYKELTDIKAWELFQWASLWSITFFYNSLNTQNQKQIASVYDLTNASLSSWMLCLTDIRNICAHFDKLWWTKMVRYLSIKHPRLRRLNLEKNSLYSYILIMYFLLKEIWIDTHFLDEIERLFSDEDYINIDKENMWFWANWKADIENLF